MHYFPLSCTSSPCNLLFWNLGVYGLVQTTVVVGTVLIWDFCVAFTRRRAYCDPRVCHDLFPPTLFEQTLSHKLFLEELPSNRWVCQCVAARSDLRMGARTTPHSLHYGVQHDTGRDKPLWDMWGHCGAVVGYGQTSH